MAKVTIGGEVYEIAPYNLKDFEDASPYLDALPLLKDLDPNVPSTLAKAVAPCVGFILPGMRKLLGETLTLDQLKARFSIPESQLLAEVMTAICEESGLKLGEVKPA